MRRKLIIGSILVAFAAGTLLSGANAIPDAPFTKILAVCEATSLDEAAMKGAGIGWPAAPEDRAWRTSFERHNGGTVRVVSWRRSAREGDGLLAFWVASGPNAHTACSFSTDREGLLEALRDRFGVPVTFEEADEIANALWRRDRLEVAFARVGKKSVVTLSRRG